MNSAHGPCACAARSRSNATSCSAWWHSRSIKYSASRSSGPRRPERRPLRPREHRENSPRSMNFARGSDEKGFLALVEQQAAIESIVYTPPRLGSDDPPFGRVIKDKRFFQVSFKRTVFSEIEFVRC